MKKNLPDELLAQLAQRHAAGETLEQLVASLDQAHRLSISHLSRLLKGYRNRATDQARAQVQAHAAKELPEDLVRFDGLIGRAKNLRIRMQRAGDLRGAVSALRLEGELVNKRIARAIELEKKGGKPPAGDGDLLAQKLERLIKQQTENAVPTTAH